MWSIGQRQCRQRQRCTAVALLLAAQAMVTLALVLLAVRNIFDGCTGLVTLLLPINVY